MTRTDDPTPEDFERAKRAAYTMRDLYSSEACNLARCHLALAARLEAAERKVEAWGPIVRAGRKLTFLSGDEQDATISAIERLSRDLKPEDRP